MSLKPSPTKLWHMAGGDGDAYRQLLREYGYLVPKTCGHEGHCECQNLPCGYPGFTTQNPRSERS